MIEFLQKYYSTANHCIYHAIMVIGLIAGSLKFKQLSFTSKLMLGLLLLTLIVEWLAYYCGMRFKNNTFVYNPFRIVQGTFVCFICFIETRRWFYPVVFLFLLLFAVMNGILFEPFFVVPNVHLHLTLCLSVVICYFVYLSLYFKRIDTYPLTYYPVFWFGAGWIIYAIVSIVSYGFVTVTQSQSNWGNVIIKGKQYSNYLLYASFIPAFLCSQKSLNDFTASSK